MRGRMLTLAILIVSLSLVAPAAAAPPDDHDVKLRVFVHYPRPGKPPQPPGTCSPSSTDSSVFGVTGWKLSGEVVYRVNYGTIPASVIGAQSAIRNSFAEWVIPGATFDFSEGAPTVARGARRDEQNVVVWGSVPGGAIAVTYTWYYPTTGLAVEIDTVMGKQLPWKYTSTGDPDLTCADLNYYDVRDILTHEIGHWVGLEDLYRSPERDLTMFGYGDKGERKKDTLGAGDIAGVDFLY